MAALTSMLKISRLPAHFSYGFLCILVTLSLGVVQKVDLDDIFCFFSELRWSSATHQQTPALVTAEPVPPPVLLRRWHQEHTFTQGQTLTAVLSQVNISSTATHECLLALRTLFDPETFKAGQKISLQLEEQNNQTHLLSLSFQNSLDSIIMVQRTDQGEWHASRQTIPLKKDTKVVQGIIQSNLCADAQKNGLPPSVVHKMIHLLSYDVDFQRDIQPGARFSVVYQREYNDQTGQERPGNVLYADIHLGGNVVQVYQFSPKKGQTDFYNHKGESIRRGLLRTPVDGARLSSGFGLRADPFHGFTKKHKGVDFAAAIGTPVMAAGDGVIEQAHYKGNYGNYILIRHNSEYKTAYAHLQRFHSHVRAGRKVSQGDIIGYIGMTGRTTGPHLHHEIHRHGQPINPKTVKSFGIKKLTGSLLKQFHAFRDSIHIQMRKSG